MSNKDTQFAGFAKLLWDELMMHKGFIDVGDGFDTELITEYQQIIARRAYDLVGHAVGSMSPIAFQCCVNDDEILHAIPDMTEWLDEEATDTPHG